MKAIIVLLLVIFVGCSIKPIQTTRSIVPESRKKEYFKAIDSCIGLTKPKNMNYKLDAKRDCEELLKERYSVKQYGFVYSDGWGAVESHFTPCSNAKTEEEKKVCGCSDDEIINVFDIEE